ncbi:MAG: phospholipid carrier-dependent glycosyltransferase [Planctomycetota bacterium]|nr:phospholipid carrier-dependent glycosyltransferase [Planctomycetota bacterium]
MATFTGLALAHAWRTPMFEGPDEDSNLEYVRYLDLEGHLATPSATPTVELEVLERGILPPLWFYVTLPLYRAVGADGAAATPVLSPHFLRDGAFQSAIAAEGLDLDAALERPGSRARYLHGLDEAGSTPEATAAIHALRLLRASAIPWALLALVASFLILRRALGCERRALWFTAALSLTPQLQFLSANINMDAMLAAWGCLAFWAMAEWIAAGDAGEPRRRLVFAGLAGAAVGLAAMTKLNGLVLLPLLGLAAVLAGRPKLDLRGGLAALLTLTMTAGPFYLWGWLESGHPLWMWAYQQASPLHNTVGQEPAVWDLAGIWGYHLVLFLTWFADLGWTSVWFEPWISYPVMALFAVGGVVGLRSITRGLLLPPTAKPAQAVGAESQADSSNDLGIPTRSAGRIAQLLTAGCVLILAAELWFNLRFSQPQGRHLYPFLVAVVFPVFLGLERLRILRPFTVACGLLSLAALPLLGDQLRSDLPDGTAWNGSAWVAVTDAGRRAAPDLAEADAQIAWMAFEPGPTGAPSLSWQARPDHSYELLLAVDNPSFEDRPWSETGTLLRSARTFRMPLAGQAVVPDDFWASLPPGAELAFQVLEYDAAGATTGRSLVRTTTR